MPPAHPLTGHPLIAALPDPEARAVLDAFEARDLLAGDVLVRAGEPGGPLHIVETGWLDVLDAADARLVAQLTVGAVVGELGFLRDVPSAAAVRATTDAVVHTLPAAAGRRLARTHAGFALALGQVAAERVVGPVSAPERPTITAVVEVGDWSGVRAPVMAAFHGAAGRRLVQLADVPDGPPGSAEFRSATRAIGAHLGDAWAVVMWTTAAEPGLSRATRNADRILLLMSPDGGVDLDLTRRASAMPANPSANTVCVTVDPAVSEPTVGDSPIPGVRRLRLPADDMIAGGLRELGRLRQLQQVVGESPVFARLSSSARRDVIRHLSWGGRKTGEAFYLAGEHSGGLFLVLNGRVVETRDGRSTAYTPGFVFGDTGLGPPRAAEATARASRETFTGFMSRDVLQRLMARHDDLRAALSDQSSADFAGVRTAAISDRASLTVIVPDDDPRWAARLEHLRDAFGGPGDSVCVDRDTLRETFDDAALDSAAGSAADVRLRAWFAGYEEQVRYPIFVARRDDIRWRRRCLAMTDHLLFVADGRDGDPAALEGIGDGMPRHLALWWPEGPPEQTARWLAAAPDVVWYHVRAGQRADLDRLARRLLGRAIGLVLGGASSRGVAHIGVADAMGAADLPLDTLAGTSSGTAIAGLLCLDLDDAEMRRRAVAAGTGFRPHLDNIGPPFVSLFSGRRATRLVRRLFGKIHLEDLPLPLKATAVDLRTGQIVVIDRGPLWQAVRAACSVPALWPPVAVDGRLLMDGGLLDNFPHWTLDSECGAGLTLVSNLDAGYATPFPAVPDYGAVLSGWRVLWNKLLGRRVAWPELGTTVVECLVLGGRAGSADLEQRVDPKRVLVVRPPVPRLELFGLKDDMVETLIDAARGATADAIASWRARSQEA